MFSTESMFVFCSTFASVFASFYLPRAWRRRACWFAAGALSLAVGAWLLTNLANNDSPIAAGNDDGGRHDSSLNSSAWQAPDQATYSI